MTSEYVRIKVGTHIAQGPGFMRWPFCVPPTEEHSKGEYEYETMYPERVFIGTRNANGWELVADGYGFLSSMKLVMSDGTSPLQSGDYGNGSIRVLNSDGLSVVTHAEYEISEIVYKTRLCKELVSESIVVSQSSGGSETQFEVSAKINIGGELRTVTHSFIAVAYSDNGVPKIRVGRVV